MHEYYDDRWKQQELSQHPGNSERVNRVSQASIAALSGKGPWSVLDIGCGNGWILEAIGKSLGGNISLYGIEPSAVGVENAQKKNAGATILQGTLEELLPFRTFDVVVCSEVIEHVVNTNAFVDAIAAVSKPGGTLVLTTPNGIYRNRYFQVVGALPQPVENWLSVTELRESISARFKIVTHRTFDLSFWLKNHRNVRAARNALSRVRGGWRAIRLLDEAFVGHHGLYQFIIAKLK